MSGSSCEYGTADSSCRKLCVQQDLNTIADHGGRAYVNMEANMKATDNHPGAPLQGFQCDSVKRLDLSTTVDTLHHKDRQI
ncbi:hypothetical protein LINPERHAP2_LOCUS10831 [Linum perenne]